MPSTELRRSASTFIGPGFGAVPGAGCGNAVDIAVWNVMFPSNFPDGLMNVAVQHRDRSKPPEKSQRLLGVVRAPAPLRIDRPKRNVRENYDRCAGRQRREVFLQPIELFLAKDSQTAFADVYDVDQPNEVNASPVETVPTGAERFLSKSLSIHSPRYR